MAHRIHVVAVLSPTDFNLEQALLSLRMQEQSHCSPFRFGSSGNWQWATASVWHVGGDEIDRVLATLECVALRTTTSDGVLWTLTVTGESCDTFRGVHFFTSVGSTDWDVVAYKVGDDEVDSDFPENEPDEVAGIDRDDSELQFLWDNAEAEVIESQLLAKAARETPWREYLDYGVVFPEETLRQMEELPSLAAQRMAFYAHGEQIADVLAMRGVTFDRDAMVHLLTVGPLTEWERESDFGNLFRFLSLLGINGVIDEPLTALPEATVEPKASGVDWSKYNGTEHLDAVRALTEGRELKPIGGGPIELKFTDIVHLLTVANFCDADDGAVMIRLQFATDDVELAEAWTNVGQRGIDFERAGRRCTIALKPMPFWLRVEDHSEFARHSVVNALATLPEGVEVELVHSVAGTSDGCHRYRGTIHNCGIQLISAHPQLTTSDIRDVLALRELTLGSTAIPIDNAEEELRIREAYYDETGDKARIRNGRIKTDGGRNAVVRCKFVTQFIDRGPWDIAGAERRRLAVAAELDAILNGSNKSCDAEEMLDPAATAEAAAWAARLEEMAKRMQLAKMVPRTDEVIFDGKVSRYFHAPILALEQVTSEEIADKDQQFAALGFAWVCDSASEKFGETISRSYAGVSNAIAMYERRTASNSHSINGDGHVLDLSNGMHEFQTHFQDGSTLVTNDIDSAKSIPKKRVFVRIYEGLTVAELWTKHLDGVDRLIGKRKTMPRDHQDFQTPSAFARIVDELIHRYLK